MSGFTPEELFYGYTNNKKELVRELITYQTREEYIVTKKYVTKNVMSNDSNTYKYFFSIQILCALYLPRLPRLIKYLQNSFILHFWNSVQALSNLAWSWYSFSKISYFTFGSNT